LAGKREVAQTYFQNEKKGEHGITKISTGGEPVNDQKTRKGALIMDNGETEFKGEDSSAQEGTPCSETSREEA